MRFFNIDFHISVIADIRSLLGELGHRVDTLSLSDHTWVFGRERDRVPGLDGMSRSSFGQRECDRFYRMERERLAEYDAFIVTHTPCLAGLYEKTGKPVICVVSTRYNCFCHTPASKAWLEDKLRVMYHRGQLILLTNNAYDAWHVEWNVGIRPDIVPSVCDYTGVKWAGGKETPFLSGRMEVPGLRHLPHGHTWQDVANAAACVTIPYNVSLMSVFERHAMGIPMLMPSGLWTLLHHDVLTDLTWWGSPNSHELESAVACSDWHSEELSGITFFDCLEDIPGMLAEGIPPTHGQVARKERILGQWNDLLASMLQRPSRSLRPRIVEPPTVVGYWKWREDFTGELRKNGTMVQIQDAIRELRIGTWKPKSYGFDLELPGHWRKRVVLSDCNSGLWYPEGYGEAGGSIVRIDGFRFPERDSRRFFNSDCCNALVSAVTAVVNTASVWEWYRKLRPAHPYTLVTTHSDISVGDSHLPILEDDLLVRWYATNVAVMHPKLKPIPVGVCKRFALEPTSSSPGFPLVPLLYDLVLAEGASTPKAKLFNVSFSVKNQPAIREHCLQVTGLNNAKQRQLEYLLDLASSRFCISPDGNGTDCYRVWEALYCRTVPVITWNPMVDMGLYDGLPVIVLDRWGDFKKEDFTEERYERLMLDFDPACLTMSRWIPNADLLQNGGTCLPHTPTSHAGEFWATQEQVLLVELDP